MGPIKLRPHYVSTIWGGERLAQLRGVPHDAADNHGEAFDVSAHPTTMGVVEEGPYAGTTLADLIASHRDDLLGDVPEDAVLQATFMDAIDNLSVQVHPEDEWARRVRDDFGKEESWYVVEASPGATILGGSTTTDMAALRAAAADDTIGERYGLKVPVAPGDFVLVRPGTMHALGPGILAVEVATFGNTTLRICDWGRGRRLDVDEAFEVLRPERAVEVNHLGPWEAGASGARTGVSCDGFQVEVVDVAGSWEGTTDGRYRVVTCVGGQAALRSSEGNVELAYTRSVLVPASLGPFSVEGTCRVLVSRRLYSQM